MIMGLPVKTSSSTISEVKSPFARTALVEKFGRYEVDLQLPMKAMGLNS